MMLLSTAAIGITSIVAVSSASAADVEKKFAWSGHVNRQIVVVDDGEETAVSHQDGQTSGSRARMKASASSDAMTLGAVIEVNTAANTNPSQNATGGNSAFSLRHSYVHASNSMGKVDMGLTAHAGESFVGVSMHGAGSAEAISGTAFDGVKFMNSDATAGSQAAGETVSGAHGSDMSGGRGNGVSYTTPKMSGFKGKVSHTQDASGSYEVTYGGDFNGMAVKAGYSYANSAGGTNENSEGGGVGIKLPTGLNASLSYRTISLESDANTANNDDPELYYATVGYDMSGVSDFGKTSIAVTYRDVENENLTGDDFEMVSFLLSQSLSDYGTSVYGGYSNIRYDTTLSDFDDINGFFMGAKVVF